MRDEEDLVGANLAYHHALGVERAYVFLDRCRDASERIVRSFPWVEVIVRPRQPDETFLSTYLTRCADVALQKARAEGFDWLLHIDADEFACGDDRPALWRWVEQRLPWRWRKPPERAGSLTAMLARVRPTTEMVIMRTHEVVPQALAPADPFWALEYFQIRGALRRPLLDPNTGEVHELRHWLGHELGKSIVRTIADVCAVGSHRWRRIDGGSAIAVEQRGFHFHFTAINAAHWLKKYRRLAEYPDHWEHSHEPVRFPKQAWKRTAATMSDEAAAEYFKRWVAVPRQDVRSHPLHNWIMRDTFVAEVLARHPFEQAHTPSSP